MAKADALARIDTAAERYAGETHATLNARPGVYLARELTNDLAEIRALVDEIEESGGGG